MIKGFTTSIKEIEQGMIVYLSGELDANSAIAADQVLENAIASGIHSLLLDCDQLQYISSAGLGVLLATYQSCKQKNIEFILYNLKPKIWNVLEIVGLHNILTIKDTEQEALLYLSN